MDPIDRSAARIEWHRLKHIAVFRALVLGDLLCAVPAWRALRAAAPQARITLVGLPWAAALVERLPCIDRFIAFPGFPGLPEIEPDLAALPGFFADMQAERFDLMLQMHGSGGLVNPLMAACGARRTAGYHEPGGYRADAALSPCWPQHGHEIDRWLGLLVSLGVPSQGRELALPVRDADRQALRQILPSEFLARPLACVHAGAQLPSRRWPARRFAAVADALARRGLLVLLTGSAQEAGLVGEVQGAMQEPCVNLTGRTDLWSFAALIERAQLLVSNDTGASHIAAALHTRSVIVSSGADVSRWAPLDASRHSVLWQDMACRPCAHAVCPTRHECARAIGVAQVLAAVDAQLQAGAGGRAVRVTSVRPAPDRLFLPAR